MRHRIFSIVGAAVLAGAALQMLLPLVPHFAGMAVVGAGIGLLGLGAVPGFVRRARVTRGAARAGWRTAGFAAGAFGTSYLIIAVAAAARIEPADSPGVAVSAVAAIASLVALLLLAPRPAGLLNLAKDVLDIGTVGASLFMIAWYFIMAPRAPTTGFLLTMLPETIGTALAVILISRAVPGSDGRALHLLSAGFGAFAVTNALTTRNLILGLPWYASAAALGLTVASVFFWLSSRPGRSRPEADGRRVAGALAALPYLPVICALAAITVLFLRTGTLVPALVWAMLATSAIAMIRQFLSLITVRRLVDSIERQRLLLDHQAHHDPLTGLPNRAAFQTRATALLAAVEPGAFAAVLLLDLDGFKPVNDTYGHAAGDELLVVMGQRFTAAMRPGDFVARLGGDEFGIVLGGLTEPEQSDEVAARLITAALEPVPTDDAVLRVQASVGIALATGATLTELVKTADRALYAAKAAGRCRAHRDGAAPDRTLRTGAAAGPGGR